MKNLFCFLLVMMAAAVASAQKVYFIYFESSDAQPFYLKLGDRLYQSTPSGSLILPELIDSTYTFTIGFAATNREVRYTVPLAGSDRGFMISDAGATLIDIQNDVKVNARSDVWESEFTYEYRTNEFTDLLAKASNDTSLYYIPIAKKQTVPKEALAVEQPKSSEVVPVVSKETFQSGEEVVVRSEENTTVSDSAAIDVVADVVKEEVVKEETQGKEEATSNKAGEKSDSLSAVKAQLAFLDSIGREIDRSAIVVADSVHEDPVVVMNDSMYVKTDTVGLTEQGMEIDVFAISDIEKETLNEYQRSTVNRVAESSTSEGFGLVFHDKHADGIDTIRILIPNPKIIFRQPDTTQFEDGLLELPKEDLKEASVQKKDLQKKDDCNVATEKDFLKLRRNMAGYDNEQDMLSEAQKYFRKKCFSTEQIRNLGSLFLTSENKFLFFKEAYDHVTDRAVYSSLQTEFRDAEYAQRFQEFIGQ